MELTHKRLRVQVLPHAAATSEEKNEEELLLYHKIMCLAMLISDVQTDILKIWIFVNSIIPGYVRNC
jgi:hypothetical protein